MLISRLYWPTTSRVSRRFVERANFISDQSTLLAVMESDVLIIVSHYPWRCTCRYLDALREHRTTREHVSPCQDQDLRAAQSKFRPDDTQSSE